MTKYFRLLACVSFLGPCHLLLAGSSASVTHSVSPAQTYISWVPSPASINVGAPLGGGQLNATASSKHVANVPGTFVYTPATGTSFSSAGAQTLKVVFTPSDSTHFLGSTGTAQINVVSTTTASSTSVSSSLASSVYGQAVSFTANVSSTSGTPSGTVSFTDGQTLLGTGTLNNGAAIFSTSALSAGSHSINAVYNGDSSHTGSSGSVAQSVSKAQTTISWVPNPASITVGAALGSGQLDATAAAPYAQSVAGTFIYSPVAGTSFSNAGSQTLNVTFTPTDTANNSGAAASATINVTSTTTASFTAVFSSAPSSTYGQAVAFTATVTSPSGTPSGTVSFSDGSTALGSGTLSNGTAVFSTSSLAAGTYTITASYNGDSSHTASSASLSQIVSAASTGAYFYVDQASGSDANSGSQSAPLKTVTAGVGKALANNDKGISTTVIINPGVYREFVDVHSTSNQKNVQMTVQAAQPGTAIIAASDTLTNWQAVSSTEYVHSWTDTVSGCSTPSSWPTLPAVAVRAEMVFVDGVSMMQIMDAADSRPGTFLFDTASSQLHIWPLTGTDMNSAVVEVAARRSTITVSNRHNVVLRGLVFRHAASCINTHGANIFTSTNILLDQVQAVWNNWGGLGASSSDSITIQNSIADHNGGVGFAGFENTNAVYKNNESGYNNWRGAMGAFYDFGMGGTKLMRMHGAQLIQHQSYRNQAQGLWFDTDNENISVTGAALSENLIANLKLEANQGPFAITSSSFCSSGSGVLMLNTAGITISNSNFYNNGGGAKWEAQLFLGGTSNGRSFTDWQTGQAYTTQTSSTTLSGNVLTNGGSGQNVFATYLSGTGWSMFTGGLHSNLNTWYDPTVNTAFLEPAGYRDTLSGWQNVTLQDTSSSWAASSAAAQNCSVPAPAYADFFLQANNRENLSSTAERAAYTMSSGAGTIPLQVKSFGDGAVTLSTSALPTGVTASFSSPTLSTGNTVLTIHAASNAVTQTISITVFGATADRVHSLTVKISIAP